MRPSILNVIAAGVMRPRFPGFEKNANAWSIGALTTVLVCSSNFAAGAGRWRRRRGRQRPDRHGRAVYDVAKRGGERRKRPHEAVALRGCWFDALAGQQHHRGFAEDRAQRERRRRQQRGAMQRGAERARKHPARDLFGCDAVTGPA